MSSAKSSAPGSSEESAPSDGPMRGQPAAKTREPPALRKFNANKEWLQERWSDAAQKQRAGDTSAFPHWYFDAVTEAQLRRIKEEGLDVSQGAPLTKGQASDVIGLFEPPEEGDAEVLKFFKVPVAEMNQTRARIEAPKLLADPEKAEAWRKRPADAMQKECLRFYGLSIPKGLTYPDAEGLISRHEVTLGREESPLLDDWENYRRILEELADRETCEEYGLKKPSAAVIRTAVEVLRSEGKTMEALADDLDVLAERIIRLKPELERAS